MVTLGLKGRRWEIFENAVYAFAEQGYENVSMRQLADISHMQAASLYYHFESKETLLELMYEFYSANIMDVSPDLNSLISKIPVSRPLDIMYQLMRPFSSELQPLMDCIIIVATTQANRDKRAYELIHKNIFSITKYFLDTTLTIMIETNKIEPFDVESFHTLYTSFLFTSALRNHTKDPLKPGAYEKCMHLLLSLIIEKQ